MNAPILIYGLPAIPELWAGWEWSVGVDTQSIRDTQRGYRRVNELAARLKIQQEKRNESREG